MKTEKYINDDGDFYCFGYPNSVFGKKDTKYFLENIQNVNIITFSRIPMKEIFCKFTYKGAEFYISEPYGDNSFYDICCETPNTKELDKIYELFSSIKLPTANQISRFTRLLILLFGVFLLIYFLKILP